MNFFKYNLMKTLAIKSQQVSKFKKIKTALEIRIYLQMIFSDDYILIQMFEHV